MNHAANERVRGSQTSGFTILELLVVIAVIGLLAAIAFASFNLVRERGRDARRIQDVQQIAKALAIYQVDNQTFPVGTDVAITGSDPISTALINDGAAHAISADPLPTYTYTYTSNGSTYLITFCLETDTVQGYAKGCSNTLAP